jgi:hypothetical protein
MKTSGHQSYAILQTTGRAQMTSFESRKLRLKARMAEVDAQRQHSARRAFLKSQTTTDDIDDPLLAFIEESVVAAELQTTRTRMLLDQHTYNCLFCLRANSN